MFKRFGLFYIHIYKLDADSLQAEGDSPGDISRYFPMKRNLVARFLDLHKQGIADFPFMRCMKKAPFDRDIGCKSAVCI